MRVMMLVYSALLTAGLVLSAPWWLLRMATTERYREGIRERLGLVPQRLREFVGQKKIVWVHAVSVGEVLAVSRLVPELEAALGEGWSVVVSTTTRTGQALARERFGAERVFYYPLDFAFAVRLYLRLLHPEAIVLAESEVWPRMLHEARRLGVPVAVVNARVSDRSFARGMKVRWLWGWTLARVSLWLAQSEEDARRLVAMGAKPGAVRVGGNLKYDVRAPRESGVAKAIRKLAGGKPILVAGSTHGRDADTLMSEEEVILQAWAGDRCEGMPSFLVLAPRHPERFAEVEGVMFKFPFAQATNCEPAEECMGAETFLLDTIGDLASVYGVADIAFIGGSLVQRGGHNPLEPALFGVPVVMGPSYENFREIVAKMKAVDGISIVGAEGLSTPSAKNADYGQDESVVEGLKKELERLLTDRDAAKAMGERGRQVFEAQQGATARAVGSIVAMIQGAKA